MRISEALGEIEIQSKIHKMRVSPQERLIILSEVIDKNLTYILSNKDQELDITQVNKFRFFLSEIFKNKRPIEKITNRAFFYGIDLYINDDVLSPRHDTEVLIRLIVEYLRIQNIDKAKILDIGTGCGCISIAIAKNIDVAKILAADISKEALLVAAVNIQEHLLEETIELIYSDLFSNINEMDFDIIVSNPPYISSEELITLDEKVLKSDPKVALDGGEQGLVFYEKILEKAHLYLKKGGMIFFEIGSKQADKIKELMKYRYIEIKIIKDYGKNNRVICGKLKETGEVK